MQNIILPQHSPPQKNNTNKATRAGSHTKKQFQKPQNANKPQTPHKLKKRPQKLNRPPSRPHKLSKQDRPTHKIRFQTCAPSNAYLGLGPLPQSQASTTHSDDPISRSCAGAQTEILKY